MTAPTTEIVRLGQYNISSSDVPHTFVGPSGYGYVVELPMAFGDVSVVAGWISETLTPELIAAIEGAEDIASITDEIVIVAGISDEVAIVAGMNAGISTLLTFQTEIETLAPISADISTVAGISANVSTVASRDADIGTVASRDADIGAVAAIDADIALLADLEDGTIATNAISNLAAISDEILIAAVNVSSIETVSDYMAAVISAADNMAAIIAAPGNASAAAISASEAQGYAELAAQTTFSWGYDETTTDSDPGSGKFRLDNASIASATNLFLDIEMVSGDDVSDWIDTWDTSNNTANLGQLAFVKVGDSSVWARFKISGPIVDDSGYRKVPITYIAHSGAWSDGDVFALQAFLSGDKGADGAGAGDVVGPSSSADGNLAIFDGTTGKLLKDTGVSIADFATSSQGAKADTAVQPEDIGSAAALDAGTSAGDVPVLDGAGKISTGVLPEAVLGSVNYKGTWDADANSPTIPAAASGNKGWFYVVETPGSTEIDGISEWGNGDWIISDGTAWSRLDAIDVVSSVAGLIGAISDTALRAALNIEDGADVTDEANVRAALASLTAAVIQNMRTKYQVGTDGTQSVMAQYGWGAQQRWATVLESNASISMYSYSADGLTVKAPFNMTPDGVLYMLSDIVSQGSLWTAALNLRDTGADNFLQVVVNTNLTANRTMAWNFPDASYAYTWPSAAGTLALTSDFTGKQSIPISAAGTISPETGGAEDGIVSLSNQTYAVKNFDPSTIEEIQFDIRMPKQWNRGTITFDVTWLHAATTTNFGVAFGLSAVAIGNDDAGNASWGTEVVVTDAGGTTNDIYVTAESAAVTVAGTPAANDLVRFRLRRLPANGSDTMAIDAAVNDINIYITNNAGTDA